MDYAAPKAFFQGVTVSYPCGRIRGQLNARDHCSISHTRKLRLFVQNKSNNIVKWYHPNKKLKTADLFVFFFFFNLEIKIIAVLNKNVSA